MISPMHAVKLSQNRCNRFSHRRLGHSIRDLDFNPGPEDK